MLAPPAKAALSYSIDIYTDFTNLFHTYCFVYFLGGVVGSLTPFGDPVEVEARASIGEKLYLFPCLSQSFSLFFLLYLSLSPFLSTVCFPSLNLSPLFPMQFSLSPPTTCSMHSHRLDQTLLNTPI